MTLTEQVFAQAQLLAGPLEQRELELLRLLCQASTSALRSKLRQNLTPEDCKADFLAGASLYALAAMSSVAQGQLTEFAVGDVTLKRPSGDTASKCLHAQAELIMAPYLQGRFSFRGV